MRKASTYNLCQKSWDNCITSAGHSVVSPSPLKIIFLHRVLIGTEKVAMLAATILFLGGGAQSFDIDTIYVERLKFPPPTNNIL